jgi:hypothetical protein
MCCELLYAKLRPCSSRRASSFCDFARKLTTGSPRPQEVGKVTRDALLGFVALSDDTLWLREGIICWNFT